MILPLSLFGAHTLKSDLHVLGNLFVYNDVTAFDFRNQFGAMTVNDLQAGGPISINKNRGIADITLHYDNTLQIVDGQLSVKPIIRFNEDYDLRYDSPLVIRWDEDGLGGDLGLSLDSDDFKVDDHGRLDLIETNYEALGGLQIVGADTEGLEDLFDTDLPGTKKKIIKMLTSDDLTQGGDRLSISSKGVNRVPFYTLNGFTSNSLFHFDELILYVPRIKLEEVFILQGDDVPTKSYLDRYIAEDLTGGINIVEIGNDQRNFRIRTDPTGCVFLDPSAGYALDVRVDGTSIKKVGGVLQSGIEVLYPLQRALNEISLQFDENSIQVGALGLAVNTLEFGGLRVVPGGGVGVSVDNVTIQLGADGLLNGNYQVLYPLQRALNEISLQIDETSMKVGSLGLAVNLSETDRGIQVLADGLGIRTQVGDVIKSGYDGLYLQLSPDDSCLAKTATGLELMAAVDSPFVKEITGLDIRVGPTLKKTLVGLEGNYMGDEDGDIVVSGNIIRSVTTFQSPLVKTGSVVSLNLVVESPDLTYANGILTCNIEAGMGLVKTGSIISLRQTDLDKLDDIPQDIGDKLDALDELGDRLSDLGKVMDTVGDIGRQIGISVGTSALTAAVTSAVSAAALGIAAQSAAQNLISSKVGAATAAAGIFSGLFGLAGGLLGSALSKKGSSNTYISYNSISNGMIEEKVGNEEDKYLYGFSITAGSTWNSSVYTSPQLAPCTVVPLLGSDLTTVSSTSSTTGMLTVAGGMGVLENIYAGGNVYSNNLRLATESFVLGKSYITSSALTPYILSTTAASTYLSMASASSTYLTQTNASSTYLTISNASSTYQPIITAGTGLTKTTNTLSVNPIQSQITQLGTLANLTVSGTSIFSDLTKHYKTVEGWQSTTTAPSNSLIAASRFTISDTSPRQIGFTAGAVIDNLDINPKVLRGTVVYNGVTYPTFYAGSYTVSALINGVGIYTHSGGNLTVSWGVAILRNGVIISYSEQASANFTAAASYATTRTINASFVLQDGDALIPQGGPINTSVTSYTGAFNFASWIITGHPLLNAWDFSSSSLSFYPDAKRINRLTSSVTGIDSNVAFTAPNLYEKGNVDTLLATKMDKFTLTDYSTAAQVTTQINNAVAPLATSAALTTGLNGKMDKFTLTDYSTTVQITTQINNAIAPLATSASLTTGLATKANTFTVSSPLTYTNNVLSVDLSGYYTKTATDSQISNAIAPLATSASLTTGLAAKQNTISVSSPITLTGAQIGLNTALITSLASQVTFGDHIQLKAGKVIHMGYDVANKQTDAGKIGYQVFSSDALDIVGAGPTAPGRIVNVYDILKVGGVLVATQTWTTNALAAKANTFTVTSPLAYANNVVSVDLSSYYTKSYLDQTFALTSYVDAQTATKESTLTFSSPLVRNTNAISLNTGAITSLGTLSSLNVSGGIDFSGISGDTNSLKLGSLQIWTSYSSGYTFIQSGNASRAGGTFTPIRFALYQTQNSVMTINQTNVSIDSGLLVVGNMAGNSSTTPNCIAFTGIAGDSSTIPNALASCIVERLYNGVDRSELLFFKGNDDANQPSVIDTIRCVSGEFYVDLLSTNGFFNYTANTLPACSRQLSITISATTFTNTVNMNKSLTVTNDVTCTNVYAGNIYTKTQIDTNLNSYVTTASLTSQLSAYVTSSSLTSTLSAYVTNSSLSSTLSSYALKTYVDGLVVTAGTGLTKTGNVISINSNQSFGSIDVTTITSPGNLDINSQSGNGTCKVTGRFQVANNVGTVMLDIGSNANVTGTGNWWSLDCNHALRVLDKTSQPALTIDWTNLQNTTGGGFQCQTMSRFDNTMVITMKNVGITKDNGTYRYLHFNGSGTGTGAFYYGLILNASMMVASGAQINVFSDRRMKEDIKTVNGEKALKVVKDLRAVSFKYKNHEQQKVGWIAQEVVEHEYVQEAISVTKTGDDEKYTLCQDQLIPVLWAAVRQQQEIIEELKEEFKKWKAGVH